MGPSMVAIEKSDNGEQWSRAALIMKMGDWQKKEMTYEVGRMDKIPSSPFQVRSQVKPNLCMGVTPAFKKSDIDKENPIPLSDNDDIQLQPCDENKPESFWYFKPGVSTLQNALDSSYILHSKAGKPKAGSGAQAKFCVNNKCPDLEKVSSFKFEGGERGGLLRSAGQTNLVLSAEKLEASKGLKFIECGGPTDVAKIQLCKENKNAQWELLPMFDLE